MTPLTFTMVSLSGREDLAAETIENCNMRGGMSGYLLNLFYFANPGRHQILNLPANVELHLETYEGMLPDFFKMLRSVPDDSDWIFLEDDIAPCLHALTQIARVEVPADVGLLSFFDMRNEWKSPGIWRNKSQLFWGTQAVRVPAKAIAGLKTFADAGKQFSTHWDTWLGAAVEALGLRTAHYAPSLVQHVGMISTVYAGPRPTADNFPGESFDALGPCPDPIVPGTWTAPRWDPMTSPNWCGLHRKLHMQGNRCPKYRVRVPGKVFVPDVVEARAVVSRRTRIQSRGFYGKIP